MTETNPSVEGIPIPSTWRHRGYGHTITITRADPPFELHWVGGQMPWSGVIFASTLRERYEQVVEATTTG